MSLGVLDILMMRDFFWGRKYGIDYKPKIINDLKNLK